MSVCVCVYVCNNMLLDSVPRCASKQNAKTLSLLGGRGANHGDNTRIEYAARVNLSQL